MKSDSKATNLNTLSGQYRIQVFQPAGWGKSELRHVLEGVEDLALLMGGSSRFQGAMRAVRISKLRRRTRFAAMALPMIGVVYFESASWRDASELKWQTVHELAHIWDMRRCFRLSRGLKWATESTYRFAWRLPIPLEYAPGGEWLKGRPAPLNAREDWADSVATYVYPDQADQRSRMISPVRWEYVGQHMQARPPYPSQWISRFCD